MGDKPPRRVMISIAVQDISKPQGTSSPEAWHELRLCCKDSRGKTMVVKSRFWLRLDNQSKQAGNEGNLSRDVPFFHPVHLPLANHIHTLISL